MKHKIEFAHMKERAFLPGINRQVEKGLDQRSCPGIQMWRVENGDLYWEYEGRSGFLGGSMFQSMVIEREELRKEVKRDKTNS